MDWSPYRAVLFDLDGVLTPTAVVHQAAWKRTFDRVIRSRLGPEAPEFTTEDYLVHVDGKPRYDGVRDFLASRGITLAEGDPSDPPGDDTVCAVGNQKNAEFLRVLAEEGVEPYPGSMRLIERLEELGISMAVVSSSANAAAVLEAAGLLDRFPVRVDGVVARELDLPGKPAPDIFTQAARRLGVELAGAVVVEDATSGVAAGRAGDFGLVVGVARHGDAADLEAAGADLVVEDLGELV